MRWPFATWLRLAVLRFGLCPAEFWEMSLVDWRVLTKSEAMHPLPRDVFDDLREQYPDGETYET